MEQTYLINLLIIFLSSFLWRVRGGMHFGRKKHKFPVNKIWYAINDYVCYFNIRFKPISGVLSAIVRLALGFYLHKAFMS